VDLTNPFRLSGLTSGAKLDLVQLSKSAGVVSIALQIPDSEAGGQLNARLTDKFPSSTTLWLVLRKFEAGVAGGAPGRNFTARGIPATGQASSGAGRLYYEQPILHCLNRELSSFTDLQKTLAQLGLNSGSALIRLSFKPTDTPLEEAMAQIQGYFDSVESPAPSQQSNPQTTTTSQDEPPITQQPEWTEDITLPDAAPLQEPSETPSQDLPSTSDTSPQPLTATTSKGRPVSVYRPPSSSTPAAARTSDNDSDYTPTIEHAQIHQKLLAENSRNKRLPTEAEIAAQAEEEAAKWAQVTDVEIKVRFPDQSAVSSKFKQSDSGADLYSFVRDCLEAKWGSEAFLLRNPGVRGKNEVIPDDPTQKLIKNLQLKGRVLVVFGWDESKASIQARGTKAVLKAELRAQAQEIQVQEIPNVPSGANDPGVKVNLAKKEPADDGGEKKNKLSKFLRLSKK
jgi:tether containing UBX domain for GLUT4